LIRKTVNGFVLLFPLQILALDKKMIIENQQSTNTFPQEMKFGGREMNIGSQEMNIIT